MLLAVLALLGEARGAALVRQELGVAATAPSTRRGQPPVAVMDELGEQLVRVQVEHRGTHRHGDLERLAAAAVEVLALAVDAVVGSAVRVIAERQERRHVVVGDQPHVAAVAAVTAVRAADGDGTLAPEADTARAAVTTASVQLALVDELGHFVQANAEGGWPSRIVASVD